MNFSKLGSALLVHNVILSPLKRNLVMLRCSKSSALIGLVD